MQIKKLLKYLSIIGMTAGVTVATSPPPLFLLNNSDHLRNQIFNSIQQVDETEYTDQLEYIRNDVAKQTGVTNSIASIKITNNGSSINNSGALVTKTDGSTIIYMWGDNTSGQLGDGQSSSTSTPIIPDSTPFGSKKIIQIAIGHSHSAALLEDGSLYMWGKNSYGELGTGSTEKVRVPKLVTALSGMKVTQIALGGSHSAALLNDGSLYMWGWNQNGQVGNGGNTGPGAFVSLPTEVTIPNYTSRIAQITLGGNHSAVILKDGSLYMWGRNDYGQLGNGTISDTASIPTKINTTIFGYETITQIALGNNHSAALLEDGSLYMWGRNDYGQLGNGTMDNKTTPTQVTALKSKKIIQIAIGYQHTAATLDDGSLYMWGLNQYGQLGNGSVIDTSSPTIVTVLIGKKVTQMFLGYGHTGVLLDDGNIYMWGHNQSGQLGFNSNNNANPIPIWMYKLGYDSHITAKSDITAKAALDNLWVNNKFNLAGFKNSFNLINIPNVTDQTYDIVEKPTYNSATGTLTMNVKIKYFYDKNGLFIADTSANPMSITGFSTVKTNISAKTIALSPIVVDKWLSYVTVNGEINRAKLEEFLTLSLVPDNAGFKITNIVPNNKTGVLVFNIETTKIFDGSDVVQDTPSDVFTITLNLTPRITQMTVTTTGPTNLNAATLKAKLFDNTGLVKDLAELKKYMTIIAPVDGAKYYLVDKTWVSHTGDGTVKFDIYVDKYYNSNGDQQAGSATTADCKVSFNLTLQREASVIALKTSLPDIRIDEFENYIKSSGDVVESSKLRDFFDFINIPSDATFVISNFKVDEYDTNFTRNHLTFDLTINEFNQGSPATPQTYTHNYELTLGTQHRPTTITAKTTYDQTIRVDEVENMLNTLNGEALVTYLSNFLDFTSIPDGAEIDVENITPNYGMGKLSFKVVPSKIYNSNSNLVTPAAGQFTFTLQFGIKFAPTEITINKNHPGTRIDEVANKIKNLEGQALYNFLVPNYVSATSVDKTELKARIISQDNNTGKLKINLTISSYYDANSDLVNEPKTYTLDYELNPKYQQTIIKTLEVNVYPKNITPAQFKQQIIDGGAVANGNNYTLTPTNITFLNKFLSFESVPTGTVYTLTWDANQTDDMTGVLSFNLNLNQYYSVDGDLVINALPINLTLNLLANNVQPVYSETKITTKAKAPSISSTKSFLDTVYPNGIASSDKLSLYVDGLQTIPTIGNITSITTRNTTDSTATFILEVSAHYDSAGALKGSKPFEFSLKLAHKYVQTLITVLPVGTYPSDLTPTQFKRQLVTDGADINGNIYTLSNKNITFMNKFFDLSTVPPSSTYTLTWNNEQTSDTTGQLGLNLIINQYYNPDGDLITNVAQPFNDLVLQLANADTPSIKSATNLKSKVGSPKVASEEEFMQMIYDNDGNLIYTKLSEFIDGLATIPTNATAVVTYITTNQGTAVFEIKLSGYYDGVSAYMINREKNYNFEINVKYVPVTVNNQFSWEWILIGVGGVVLIGTVIWLTIKKRREAAIINQLMNRK